MLCGAQDGTDTPMHLERAEPLCCALAGWVIAWGRLGISQDPSDRLPACTQWLNPWYDQEPKRSV